MGNYPKPELALLGPVVKLQSNLQLVLMLLSIYEILMNKNELHELNNYGAACKCVLFLFVLN